MRKLIITVFALLAPALSFALPIGNPWEASLHRTGLLLQGACFNSSASPNWYEQFSIRFGYWGDFVFNHPLQLAHGSNRATIHKTQINTNAAYLALNACDRFDLFGTLGATQVNLSTPGRAFQLNPAIHGGNAYIDINNQTAFSWSLGLRATLWQWGCLGVGAEAQYFWTHPHLNSVSSADLDTFYFKDNKMRYYEWQVGVGASYRIGIASCSFLVPYLGIKWSRCKMTFDNASDLAIPNITLLDLKNNRYWGYATGITLVGCSKASVTVEGRYRNEKAVFINGQFRF
jgi:hypothetical protein